MKGILDGIRVLEITTFIQGPVAGSMLGDMGAEVIKIEDRNGGDLARRVIRLTGKPTGLPAGRNFFFENNNRNKKSITIDLKTDAGIQLVYRLVARSDVFLHNIRMQVLERLGLDYASLSQRNPKLIYVNSLGMGPKGPERNKPVLDSVAVARSGMMQACGDVGQPPAFIQHSIADSMGAMTTAYGVLAALLARERYGVGQEVNTSLFSAIIALQRVNIGAALATGQSMPRWDRTQAGNPIFNYYRAADDKWFFISLHRPADWSNFCHILGLRELEADSRFIDLESRAQNSRELVTILDELFATKPLYEWATFFEEGDFVFSPINTIEDFIEDPQVLANDYIVEQDHCDLGQYRMVGYPIDLPQTPLSVQREAPQLGEHTDEVLTQILGCTPEEIAGLRNDEVI